MPELPEVETIRRSLEPRLLGARLEKIDILSPKNWHNEFNLDPLNETVEKIGRHGKYLLIHLESAVLVVHFRMTGKLLFRDEPHHETIKHTRWISYWTDKDDKPLRLDFQDTRSFGSGVLLPKSTYKQDPALAKLGPDALTGDYTPDTFATLAKKRSQSKVKGLLLDQTFIAGLGNIYADEVLFRAGIRPDRTCGRTSYERLKNLATLIKPLLEEAVGLGGTSFRDYVDSFGKRGVFALELDVYQRTGEPCHICGTPIRRIKVAGRSTHFCPHCQR